MPIQGYGLRRLRRRCTPARGSVRGLILCAGSGDVDQRGEQCEAGNEACLSQNNPPRHPAVTCAFVVVGFCSSIFKGFDS